MLMCLSNLLYYGENRDNFLLSAKEDTQQTACNDDGEEVSKPEGTGTEPFSLC